MLFLSTSKHSKVGYAHFVHGQGTTESVGKGLKQKSTIKAIENN